MVQDNTKFYDSIIGIPVVCANTGVSETGKCEKSITIDVKVYCSDSDYSDAVTDAAGDINILPLIYKLSDFAAFGTNDFKTIYFSKLDTA